MVKDTKAGGGFKAGALRALVAALILVFLIVVVQNTTVVTLRLLFWKVSMSQVLLIPLI